jgi:CRISPR-associated endonuclease/helicase Cas3
LSFEVFFRRATGAAPYGYQARVARDGLPAVVAAPTGTGKTGLVLAWLWRLLYAGPLVTPRRLVYALPQRSLVEQVAGVVEGWLANLKLADEVASHVVMGGEGTTQRRWRMDMHRPAVVVGTVDSLVSKALNRGYGIARAAYPIDFALTTNGAHWIVDEVQLCPESTTTLRQLAAFVKAFGTAEPFGLTCMSATVPQRLLGTVDNPAPGADEIVGIAAEERVGALARRLQARRTVRRLPADAGDAKAVASAVLSRHRPGTLTLVVVNTVKAARGLYAALGAGDVPATLLHSRFRGADRSRLMGELTDIGDGGRIVVATQVVEAGVDLDAAVLVTEAAPWPSVVQRAGRCNRTGDHRDAELWWLPPASHEPYPQADVAAAVAELAGLEGAAVTGEGLQERPVQVTPPEVTVLRRADLVALFDTAPDLSGADVDIAPYVRDADDSDVQLAWATWDGAVPPDDAVMPAARYRCRVPLRELARFGRELWRRDQAAARWVRVSAQWPARPGEVLVVAAQAGGYDPRVGFNLAAKGPVPDCPPLAGRVGQAAVDRAAGGENAFGEDTAGDRPRAWVTLNRHGEQTRAHAIDLLTAIKPTLPLAVAGAVVDAAYAHDVGKCHKAWQDALCALAGDDDRAMVAAGRPWAKSATDSQLRVPGGLRHELVSLLLLDGPLAGLLPNGTERDLVRYLVLAHHGKLRVQVREAAEADPQPARLLGLSQGEVVDVPAMLGQQPGQLIVDLDPFTLGGPRSWTRTVLALRDRYGPFVLAYLETLVRIADWRASADEDPATTTTVVQGVP